MFRRGFRGTLSRVELEKAHEHMKYGGEAGWFARERAIVCIGQSRESIVCWRDKGIVFGWM